MQKNQRSSFTLGEKESGGREPTEAKSVTTALSSVAATQAHGLTGSDSHQTAGLIDRLTPAALEERELIRR